MSFTTFIFYLPFFCKFNHSLSKVEFSSLTTLHLNIETFKTITKENHKNQNYGSKSQALLFSMLYMCVVCCNSYPFLSLNLLLLYLVCARTQALPNVTTKLICLHCFSLELQQALYGIAIICVSFYFIIIQ